MKKRYRFFDFVFLVCALMGLGMLLYPFYTDYQLKKAQTMQIERYDTSTNKLSASQKSAQKKRYEQINKNQASGKAKVKDPFTGNSSVNLKKIALPKPVGVIDIPKINLKSPIYPTSNEMALEEGVGVLEGTSLPVGGNDTHSVITGHRGLSLGQMFTDLPELKLGDHFYIHVLGEIHAYQVDQILTIKPDDLTHFDRDPKKDLITLVTCTPLGINDHRLLVRGHRVPYKASERDQADFWTFKNCLILGLVILFISGLGIILWRRRRKSRGENGKAE